MTTDGVARLRAWSLRLTIVGFAALVLAQTLLPRVDLFLAAAAVIAVGLAGFGAVLVLRRRAAPPVSGPR